MCHVRHQLSDTMDRGWGGGGWRAIMASAVDPGVQAQLWLNLKIVSRQKLITDCFVTATPSRCYVRKSAPWHYHKLSKLMTGKQQVCKRRFACLLALCHVKQKRKFLRLKFDLMTRRSDAQIAFKQMPARFVYINRLQSKRYLMINGCTIKSSTQSGCSERKTFKHRLCCMSSS